VTALATAASAHGVITFIEGANGVTMPGLSIADGTPRDCSSNGCGSQADTAIIRDSEMDEVGPLGRTQGNGPVVAETMIANFMGNGSAPTNDGASDSVGVEDDISEEDLDQKKRKRKTRRQFRERLAGLFGGGNDDEESGDGDSSAGGGGTGIGGLFGGGGDENDGPPEASVASTAGEGESGGLPTCADDGTITMTYRQVHSPSQVPSSSLLKPTLTPPDKPGRRRPSQRRSRRHIRRHRPRRLPDRRGHRGRARPRLRGPLARHQLRLFRAGADARGHDVRGDRRGRGQCLRRARAERGCCWAVWGGGGVYDVGGGEEEGCCF
ncbi:DUF3129 domain-containing protein, partial [Candidatus Bathyarchaeota archaeon]|nr:DUF3129 domain-containing protein [Candidatus Bathyarchaeota archaeon]